MQAAVQSQLVPNSIITVQHVNATGRTSFEPPALWATSPGHDKSTSFSTFVQVFRQAVKPQGSLENGMFVERGKLHVGFQVLRCTA